jgi:hypothetical protein
MLEPRPSGRGFFLFFDYLCNSLRMLKSGADRPRSFFAFVSGHFRTRFTLKNKLRIG